jgi:hypothetical protein
VGTCSNPETFNGGGSGGTDVAIFLPSGCSLAASTPATIILKGIRNARFASYPPSYFFVSTIADQAFVPPSASVNIIQRTAPGAPTGVLATPLNGHARITWTPPAVNGGSTITSFSVVARDASNKVVGKCGQVGSPPAVDGCTIFGLTSGITYTVRVKATNAIGTSAASSGATVTPH